MERCPGKLSCISSDDYTWNCIKRLNYPDSSRVVENCLAARPTVLEYVAMFSDEPNKDYTVVKNNEEPDGTIKPRMYHSQLILS